MQSLVIWLNLYRYITFLKYWHCHAIIIYYLNKSHFYLSLSNNSKNIQSFRVVFAYFLHNIVIMAVSVNIVVILHVLIELIYSHWISRQPRRQLFKMFIGVMFHEALFENKTMQWQSNIQIYIHVINVQPIANKSCRIQNNTYKTKKERT